MDHCAFHLILSHTLLLMQWHSCKQKDCTAMKFTCLLPLVGLQLSAVVTPLTISDTVSIMCSTDFDVTTIEWIRDGITVANSSNQSLSLLLDPVSADHHNTQYTCRVISPYGIQEETINITVQSKSFVRVSQTKIN